MTDSDIRAVVLDLARRELRIDGPLPEQALSQHLDSLQRLTLVVAIEDHFSIAFDPDDEAEIDTVDGVVALIGRKVSRGA